MRALDVGNLRREKFHRGFGFFERARGLFPFLVVGGVVDGVIHAGEVFSSSRYSWIAFAFKEKAKEGALILSLKS